MKTLTAACGIALGLVFVVGAAAGEDTHRDALRALQALRSATTIGITYQDYARRLVDTKIIVDRDLATDEAGARLKLAMGYYGLAGRAWSEKVCCARLVAFDSAVQPYVSCKAVPALQASTRSRANMERSDLEQGAFY